MNILIKKNLNLSKPCLKERLFRQLIFKGMVDSEVTPKVIQVVICNASHTSTL